MNMPSIETLRAAKKLLEESDSQDDGAIFSFCPSCEDMVEIKPKATCPNCGRVYVANKEFIHGDPS